MYGIAGAVIGVAYVLRAVGDVGAPALSWLSPIGWYQGMHAFSGLRWWPALLLLAARRGHDRRGVRRVPAARHRRPASWPPGRVPTARGPGLRGRSAWPGTSSAASVIGWAAGLFLMGLAYGSIGDDVGDLVGDSETTQEVFLQGATDLVEGFYATALLMLALIACGFAISSALRPRGEEDAGTGRVAARHRPARRRAGCSATSP